MKTLLKTSLLAIGCCASFILSPSFATDETPKQVADLSQSNPGSYQVPIILPLKNIKTPDMLEAAQTEYIREHHQGYRIIGKSYSMKAERYIQTISLVEENTEIKPEHLKRIYFDMTDAYHKLKARGRENREKITELENLHKPMAEEQLIEQKKHHKNKKS